MQTGDCRCPVTREKQMENLERLRTRKVGQLRAYQQAMFLIDRERMKEERELEIIEEAMGEV